MSYYFDRPTDCPDAHQDAMATGREALRTRRNDSRVQGQ